MRTINTMKKTTKNNKDILPYILINKEIEKRLLALEADKENDLLNEEVLLTYLRIILFFLAFAGIVFLLYLALT